MPDQRKISNDNCQQIPQEAQRLFDAANILRGVSTKATAKQAMLRAAQILDASPVGANAASQMRSLANNLDADNEQDILRFCQKTVCSLKRQAGQLIWAAAEGMGLPRVSQRSEKKPWWKFW